jgi:O-antigen/teichoic acid export membrane protein
MWVSLVEWTLRRNRPFHPAAAKGQRDMAWQSMQARLRGAIPALRLDGRALLSMAASLGLRIAGLLGTFGLGLVLARLWSPADFGIYGLVISVAALATTFCQLGTPQLAVREFAVLASENALATVRARSATFQSASLLASLVPVGLAALLLLFDQPFLNVEPRYWLIGSLLNVLAVQTVVLSAGLRGVGQMTQGQFMDILGRPVAALALVLGAWLVFGRPDIGSVLMIQLAVAFAAAAICQWWFLRATRSPDQASGAAGKPWLGAAIPLGVVDVLRQLDGTYGLILMGWLVAGTELGWFRVALACAALINMPISVFHVVLAPRLAVLFRGGGEGELQALLGKVSLMLTAICGGIVLILALFGEALVTLAFGAPYAGAAQPLLVIAIAQLAFSLFGMGPILLLMTDQERPLTVIYVIAVLGGIIAALVLIPIYGAVGAALAQLVSLTVIGAASDFVARRRLGLRVSWLRLPGSVRAA